MLAGMPNCDHQGVHVDRFTSTSCQDTGLYVRFTSTSELI
jgi:hypothetical protein